MQKTSDLYRSLVRANAQREVRATISGDSYSKVFTQDKIYAATTVSSLFADDGAVIGCACAKQLDMEIVDALVNGEETIPKAAKIVLQMRLVSENSQSEWINKGTFFIDFRTRSETNDILRISCYDAMLKCESPYFPSGSSVTEDTWSGIDIDCVKYIALQIGLDETIGGDGTVGIDPRTLAILTRAYPVAFPGLGDDAYTMREVLSNIAAMYAGNWIINDDNLLQLVQFSDIVGETNLLVDEYRDSITFRDGVRIIV